MSTPYTVHALDSGRFSVVQWGPVAYTDNEQAATLLAEALTALEDVLSLLSALAPTEEAPQLCDLHEYYPRVAAARAVIRKAKAQ